MRYTTSMAERKRDSKKYTQTELQRGIVTERWSYREKGGEKDLQRDTEK